MAKNEQRDEWMVMIRWMIADVRRRNPDDRRTDLELCISMHEHFAKTGLIKKRPDGKFEIPALVGDPGDPMPWEPV